MQSLRVHLAVFSGISKHAIINPCCSLLTPPRSGLLVGILVLLAGTQVSNCGYMFKYFLHYWPFAEWREESGNSQNSDQLLSHSHGQKQIPRNGEIRKQQWYFLYSLSLQSLHLSSFLTKFNKSLQSWGWFISLFVGIHMYDSFQMISLQLLMRHTH